MLIDVQSLDAISLYSFLVSILSMDVPYYLGTVCLAGPHSFLSKLLKMKPKWLDFPGLKIPASEAVLPHLWVHRASALQTLLLHLCVVQVELATSCLTLR